MIFNSSWLKSNPKSFSLQHLSLFLSSPHSLLSLSPWILCTLTIIKGMTIVPIWFVRFISFLAPYYTYYVSLNCLNIFVSDHLFLRTAFTITFWWFLFPWLKFHTLLEYSILWMQRWKMNLTKSPSFFPSEPVNSAAMSESNCELAKLSRETCTIGGPHHI